MYPLPANRRIALSFSGGKDSAACLKLLRPQLKNVTVVWCNPGNPFPALRSYMDRIAASVPNFVEVTGDLPAFQRQFGYAVDTLPVWNTALGKEVTGSSSPYSFTSPFHCCQENMWLPLQRYLEANHFDCIIRGQKKSDKKQNRTAQVEARHQGIEFLYPLEDWTDAEVMAYLGPDDVPPFYADGAASSQDCRTCLAYEEDNPQRLHFLKTVDVSAYQELKPVHTAYTALLREALDRAEKSHE